MAVGEVRELAILRVLWDRGASSVCEVFEALNAARPEPLAYTTALRFLQIMTFDGCQVGGYGRYVLALTLWKRARRTRRARCSRS